MKNFPLFKVHVSADDAIKEAKKVLESGFLNEGEQVSILQESLKKYLGENLVLVNSCTSAIHLALHLCDISPGDEIITTPMTCVASNTPIIAHGARPVWADIDPETGMISPESLRDSITDKTRAVIYVAWAGNLGDIEEIQKICREREIPLILDAAHAFGAKIELDKIRPISDIVDYTCYSFQAIKHFTTGDGGALVCNTPELSRAKRLKWFGLDRDAAKDEKGNWKGQQWDIDIEEPGYKFNMNNLSAAIGLSQLPFIDEILRKHEFNAKIYDRIFENTHVKALRRSKKEISSRWVYTVRTHLRGDEKLQAIKALNEMGIAAGLVHVPNDIYSCFSDYRKDLPGLREFETTQFSIPCGWWLNEEDVYFIAEKVKEITK